VFFDLMKKINLLGLQGKEAGRIPLGSRWPQGF
jgi:hypothetical protein